MRGRLEVMRSIVASYCEDRHSGMYKFEVGRGCLRCEVCGCGVQVEDSQMSRS